MQPQADKGYFNLEMNAGGSHLCNYIEDPTRVAGRIQEIHAAAGRMGRPIPGPFLAARQN